MSPPILYSGLSLDRAHRTRRDGDPAALIRHAHARFAPFWRGLQLIGGTPPAAIWAGPALAMALIERLDAPFLLLGEDAQGPLFALDVSALEAGEAGPDLGGGLDGTWQMLRTVGRQLDGEDAALLAYARGMLIWRGRTRFCSVCGTPLRIEDAGHSARCTAESCATPHFPRTDPAIIVLVQDSRGRALLGRQPVWTPGMYSCLAGFVEPGETLEEAVAREVWEEAGIRVAKATYVASQPWPFPSSLMLGFNAVAVDGEPQPDAHEIEDARWFERAEVARFGEADAPGEAGRFLPRLDSISRALIEAWLKGA